MTLLPLRTLEERLQFCDDFFASVGAAVVEQDDAFRAYKLPLDVDKELTDRPFHWLWLEQTGQPIEPTVLRLAFSTEALERENKRLHDDAWSQVDVAAMSEVEKMFFRPPSAELIALGGFRLNRIMDVAEHRGRFVCARPKNVAGRNVIPWVAMNAVVSYVCDLAKQEFVSLGFCLVNGQMVDNFWDAIRNIPMEAVHPREILTLKQEESLELATQQLHQYLEKQLDQGPQAWAEEAKTRVEAELEELDLYYTSLQNLDDEMDAQAILETEHLRKRAEIKNRGEPRIEVEIVQWAIVGLLEV